MRVGPSCLNPFTVHPVEIAGQTAVLDASSNGRAFLGLARGSWLEPLGLDQSDPVTAIREAWEIVRRLLAGDDSGFSGSRFSLPHGQQLRFPVARKEVPLLVGTWSPRLAAFAGEAAQELKVGGSANPAVVPVIRERIGNPDVRIVLGAVTFVDDDGDLARSVARREVAMYLAVVAELDPTVSLEPELVTRVRDLVTAGDDEGAGALISDDVLDLFAFAEPRPGRGARRGGVRGGRRTRGLRHPARPARAQGSRPALQAGASATAPLDHLRLWNETAFVEARSVEHAQNRIVRAVDDRLGDDPPTAGASMKPRPLKPAATQTRSRTRPRIAWWSGVTS